MWLLLLCVWRPRVCACAYEFPCARGGCPVHAVSFALHSCVRGLWPLVAACVHVEGRAMRGCGCFRVGAVVIAHVCTAFACVPCVWPCVCLLPAAVLMHVVCVNTRLCIYAFCQTQLRVVVVVLRLRLSCAVVPLCVSLCGSVYCRSVCGCVRALSWSVCVHGAVPMAERACCCAPLCDRIDPGVCATVCVGRSVRAYVYCGIVLCCGTVCVARCWVCCACARGSFDILSMGVFVCVRLGVVLRVSL